MIYHYTTLYNAVKIFETGYLKVSFHEKLHGVKPAALWLSKNPLWEPTASKGTMECSNEDLNIMTFQEQHGLIGCTRFILPFKKAELCSWARYKYASNTPIQIYHGMELAGIHLGARPSDWYTSFNDISLDKVVGFEIWDGSQWVNHNDDFMDAIEYHVNRLNGEDFKN